MNEKFRKAVSVLRRSRSGRRSLYEIPWYVLIGPLGCGKTSLIVNSGLGFPLADDLGGRPDFCFGGGTRSLDWFFTDEAIFLDTEGRFTTQDSGSEIDSAQWLEFLDLLRKYRPRLPINGFLVVQSLADLMRQSQQERSWAAAAIRARIDEAAHRCGVRFPVYFFLSKCDLIAGFREYFVDLGEEGRAQVWGLTLGNGADGEDQGLSRQIETEMDLLIERLDAGRLARIDTERDIHRRAAIFHFPRQVAALRSLLAEFVEEAFAQHRFSPTVLLRGLYFTSAVQAGTPMDRAATADLEGVLGEQPVESEFGRTPFSGASRSYFVTDVFRHVVVPEAHLAAPKSVNRRLNAFLALGAAMGVALVAACYGFIWGPTSQVQAELSSARDAMFATAEDHGDSAALVTALDRLHGVTAAATHLPAALVSSRELIAAALQAYRGQLRTRFLPAVAEQLRAAMAAPADARRLEATRGAYAVLCAGAPGGADAIRAALQAYWGEQYAQQLALRERLAFHLENLLSEPLGPSDCIPASSPLMSAAGPETGSAGAPTARGRPQRRTGAD